MELEEKYICTECGQDLERRLLHYIRHNQVCTKDSPNSSIAAYRNVTIKFILPKQTIQYPFSDEFYLLP